MGFFFFFLLAPLSASNNGLIKNSILEKTVTPPQPLIIYYYSPYFWNQTVFGNAPLRKKIRFFRTINHIYLIITLISTLIVTMEIEYRQSLITSPTKKRKNSESNESSPTKRLRRELPSNTNIITQNCSDITSTLARRRLFSDTIFDVGLEVKKWIIKVCLSRIYIWPS